MHIHLHCPPHAKTIICFFLVKKVPVIYISKVPAAVVKKLWVFLFIEKGVTYTHFTLPAAYVKKLGCFVFDTFCVKKVPVIHIYARRRRQKLEFFFCQKGTHFWDSIFPEKTEKKNNIHCKRLLTVFSCIIPISTPFSVGFSPCLSASSCDGAPQISKSVPEPLDRFYSHPPCEFFVSRQLAFGRIATPRISKSVLRPSARICYSGENSPSPPKLHPCPLIGCRIDSYRPSPSGLL
jgi:hypothetical protein